MVEEVEPPYVSKLYSILQDSYGDKFTHTPQSFEQKINSDSTYRAKVYGIVKDVYGDKFTHTPESFDERLGLKKKVGGEPSNGNTGQQSTLGGQGNPFVQPPNVSNVQVPNAPTKQPTVEQEWTAPRFDKPKNVVVPNIGEIPNTAPPPIKQEGLPQRLKTFKESLSSIVNNPEDEDLYVLKNPKNKDLTQGLEDERLNEENVNTLLEKMRVKYDKENPNTPIQPYELLKIKEDLRNNFNSRKITIDAFNIASSKTQKETGINPVTSNFLSKPDRVKLLEEQTKSKKLYKKQSGEIKNQFDLVIDESSVKFSEISKQLQKQYQTEFDATILPIQQQLQDKYQQLVNSGQIDEQTANQQLKQELGQAQEEIQKQLGEQYQPKFNELNSAIQNENKLIQTRFNQKQTELTNRVNTYNKEQFDKYVSKYDIPQNVKDSFEKNFEDSLKEVYVKKNKEAMQQWSNLSRTDQLTKTLQVGTVDGLESVAGLLGYVKFNEAHLVTKDLFDKFMSDNQLPEINLKDDNSMYDWLVVNGVRSIPIMAASLPGSFAGARLGAGLAQSIISTSKLSKTIGRLIGGGVGNWSTENLFFERMGAFNDALEQGFTLEQASNIAVTTGKYDLATIPLQILEMAPIFGKGLKFITSPLVSMSANGLEEIIQGYASTHAVELEKQRLGQFTTDTSWFEYFVSPRALEEGVLGAAMGGMFSITGALTNNSQQVQQMTMQNALSKFGEDKTRTLLDMMYFNDIMTEEEHKTALSNLDKNVKAAEFVQVFSPKIQAPLMNMLVANEILEEQKTGNLMLDTAIDAAKKKNENEISKIINGDTPVYSYTQGDKTPIVVTKEQMLSNIADPEFIKGVKDGTFKVDLTNDAAMQKKLDEALLEETEKPKVKKGKAKEKGTIIVNDKIIESLTPEEKVTAKIKAKLTKPDKTKVVKTETVKKEPTVSKKEIVAEVKAEPVINKEYIPEILKTETIKPSNPVNIGNIPLSDIKIAPIVRKKVEADLDKGNNSTSQGDIALKYNSDGTLEIMDGAHRFIQAERDGKKSIDANVFNVEQEYEKFTPKAEKPEMVPANPQIDKTYEGAKVDKVQEKPNAKEKGAKAPPPKLPITVKNIESSNIDNNDSKQKVQTKKEGKEPQKAVPEKVESESEKRKSQDINNLAGIVNEYNALSPHQKTTKNGKDYVQRILNGSRKLGFTMSQNNSNRKITVKKENGKKLTKIGKTEQLPEPDKADVIHALQEIDKGILIWNGDVLSPHIDLGIEWGDIRKGEKDLKSGKMTVPAKRLVEALRQAKEKDNYDFVVGGGAARGITHSVTLLEATPEQIETTEQEDAEITANELPLRNEYIEYFDSLPLSEQEKEFNSLYDEVAERRSQTATTQNPSQDISKKDVPDKKTPLELASEKRRAAKEKLRAQGLGIASDPKQKAKLLLEYHEALVGEAKEYIKLGVKTGKEFAKAIGEKFTKAVKEAWLEATGKTPPKTDKDFEDVFEKAQPKEEKYADPKMTKIANAIVDAEIEGKFGLAALDSVIAKLQDTDTKKIYEQAKAKIKASASDFIYKVRKRVMEHQNGSELDQAILLYDAAELKAKEQLLRVQINETEDVGEKLDLSRDLITVQNERMDNAVANRSLGRSASTIFRIRQVWVDDSPNEFDMLQEFQASKGVDKLSPEDTKYVKDYYEKLSEMEANIIKLREQERLAREEAESLRKENELLKGFQETATQQRKRERGVRAETAIEKSQKRVQQAKARLKALANRMNDATRVIPEAAIEISKIAAEKVYQGAVKFEEVVANVLDEIKDIFPTFTEKDIREHLEFTKPSKPTSEVAKIFSKIKAVAKMQGKIERGEFSKPERKAYEKSAALKEAERNYAKERLKWDIARREELMANRPVWAKIQDSILRWQRFAILSYPSTIIKLAGVVANNLIFKPIRFALNAGIYNISKIISPSYAGKLRIYGAPKLSSLAKYYGEFFRNFSLQSFDEQIKGLDVAEAQYGKPLIYDEWKARTGWMEVPGRSHGYIKSFVKRPEFEFANNQLMQWHIDKMHEIENLLSNPNLSDEQRADLQNQKAEVDVTNQDVLDRIGKLSIEHGKWSILMNDNNAVKLLRETLEKAGGIGYLFKTELPILKIPTNYIERAFTTKFGLAMALIGKHWGYTRHPGIFQLAYKGTKDLTPEQADMLARTINQGTIGATLFTLGYMLFSSIDYDEKEEEWIIYGLKIPKILTHLPEYESLFSGAMMRKKFEEGDKKDAGTWINEFVKADFELLQHLPLNVMLSYGFIPSLYYGIKNDSDGKIPDAVAKKIQGMIEPGLIKQIAEYKPKSDFPFIESIDKPGYFRKPSGDNWNIMLERFKTGIPGLRQEVKEAPIPYKESSTGGTYGKVTKSGVGKPGSK